MFCTGVISSYSGYQSHVLLNSFFFSFSETKFGWMSVIKMFPRQYSGIHLVVAEFVMETFD